MIQQELVIASRNEGKILEIKSLLKGFKLLSLNDIGFSQEIQEPYPYFEENALEKANAVYRFCGKHVFADDSGLCVHALNGAPGVQSAYFGGLPRSDRKNNDRLLKALSGESNRSAFYKAVICLIFNGKTYFFEGICPGRILEEPEGSGGFGYDPLFAPEGFDKSFGLLPAETKNKISHRAQALNKMISFLEAQ